MEHNSRSYALFLGLQRKEFELAFVPTPIVIVFRRNPT